MAGPLVPDSAPFTEAQRAWLNGFLAGWVGMQSTVTVSGVDAAGALSAVQAAPSAPIDAEESMPWHDPNLPIGERMSLAEGRPRTRRLMATLAQLDCGACGYVCKTYSEAIADGSEKNLTLCSPGGRETAKMIKSVLKEQAIEEVDSGAPAVVVSAAHDSSPRSTLPGTSRANPVAVSFQSSTNLNLPGSAKHTAHVVIDLADTGLKYRAGDALGVFPVNDPELVAAIVQHVGCNSETQVVGPDSKPMTLSHALTRHLCLRTVSEELLSCLATVALDPEDRTLLDAMMANDDFDELDVLDVLQQAPSAKPSAADFVSCLSPLSPRLYSIASSQSAHTSEVHLTVGRVATQSRERERLGVASTMFANRLQPGDPIDVFVHASTDFAVPEDSSAPMIMVGPGTGIAPFRSFLQERQARGGSGKNWLFFGDQRSETDFLYRDELAALQHAGVLTRLDTAFSRDQAEKVYVQDRMRQHGAELFRWLQEGGFFFVCGDARRMAADVDRALHDVIAEHGCLSPGAAAEYVQELKRQRRYVRDVY